MLFIQSAQPNPLGKDAVRHTARPEQLLGEWVVLLNKGSSSLSLADYHLSNLEFDSHCVPKPQSVIYWRGDPTKTLAPGQTVRVHTGRSADWWAANQEDKQGVHYHSFAERSWFVLNNRCGDAIGVWTKDRNGDYQRVDSAAYDPNPPEGVILGRSGDKLVVTVHSRLRA